MALVVAMGVAPLHAKESAVSILERLPRQIAGLPHGEVRTYGDPRLGASIPFNAEGLTITLYVYDLGQTSIQDGLRDPVIQQTFEGAKGEIASSYAHVQLLGAGSEKIDGQDATLCARFEMEMKRGNEPQPVLSELHVFGAQNEIFKLRITIDKAVKEKATPQASAFIAALLKAVAFLPPGPP